ncbi:hypothetical protein F5888DRAFT_1603010 [Russula emetica]|nr:hypothetical protein F5888DRAFT_1603010 [Russula emetica]
MLSTILSVLLVTFAYLLRVGYVSVPLTIKPQLRSGVPSNTFSHHHIETQRLAPGSYRTDARERFVNIYPPLREGNVTTRNTVAVVLNWSRFPNVRRIVSLLCSPELDSFMKRVLVWNNNPKPLTYLDFIPITCSEEKLEIINSMENVYFHARFLGCSQSDAEYCFVQDDDYLILPEVIQALHARITELDRPSAVHLLPPHERLSSDLRTVYARNSNSALHAAFSWLGHGAIMHHSLASEFLLLLQILNCSKEEVKMADNYFSVLRNHPLETWFDQGIELGGGQAFTVGSEGHERNKKHILKAAYYLDNLLGGDVSAYQMRTADGKLPFTSLDKLEDSEGSFVQRRGLAPCLGRPCVFETNVVLLPAAIRHSCERAQDMLDLEEQNLRILGDNKVHYLSYPPSLAVDGKPDTAFRSLLSATQGDTITLDMLLDVSTLYPDVQITLLVDNATERILRACKFEMSADGYNWVSSRLLPVSGCLGELRLLSSENLNDALLECSFMTLHRVSEMGSRYFRAHLTEDREERWAVYEMWIRGYLV